MTDTPIRIHTTQTIAVNSNNGLYTNGVAFNIQKKYDVATIYLRLKEKNKERRVAKEPCTSCQEIVKETRVGKDYAMKVIAELKTGQLIDPTSVKQRWAIGPGSKTLTPFDKAVLLYFRAEKNNRTIEDTRLELYERTGKIVSVLPSNAQF